MKKSNRILGLTLARGGSKAVPKKNIRPILGVPLISYTIAEALRSKLITRYIVSTDDNEIREVAMQFGADAPFLRPAEYATDSASSASAIQHAVDWVERQEGIKYDYVIELMCTNPMKTVVDIDAVIEKLITTGADSVIAVHKLEDHHPIRIKKIVDDRIVDFCLPEVPEMRRQDLQPDAYIRSGSIYAMRRDHLVIDGLRYGSKNSRPYILPPERAVNVDTEIDFLLVESLLEKISRERAKQCCLERKVDEKNDVCAIAIIPTKTDSRRLKNKNLKKIGGKTLVEYSIDYALNSEYVEKVVVSTESGEVRKICKKYSNDDVIVRDRPENLLKDASLYDVYMDVFQNQLTKLYGVGISSKVTHIIGLQPDHPDRTRDLDSIIKYVVENDIGYLFTVDKDGIRNGSVLIMTLQNLISEIINTKIGSVIDNCTNIHNAYDLRRAEINIKKQFKQRNKGI